MAIDNIILSSSELLVDSSVSLGVYLDTGIGRSPPRVMPPLPLSSIRLPRMTPPPRITPPPRVAPLPRVTPPPRITPPPRVAPLPLPPQVPSARLAVGPCYRARASAAAYSNLEGSRRVDSSKAY